MTSSSPLSHSTPSSVPVKDYLSSHKGRVDAASASREMVKEKADLNPRVGLQISTMSSLWIYDGTYFVKMLENGHIGDEELEQYRVDALEREISMMILAGDDCAVQPVGRVHLRGTLCGVIMPLGFGITGHISPLINEKEMPQPPAGSIPSPRQVIKELTGLVSRLHAKGIIHSDIKPSNLLLDKTSSRLLFCDFGCAALESWNRHQFGSTTQYISPFRTVMSRAPLVKADDLYPTGITMWQLYTGHEPFNDIDYDFLDDVIASGFQPNLLAVDDNTIRELITSYLEAGNPPLPEGRTFRGNNVCVTARVVFVDCVGVPPHSYEKIVHCEGCNMGKCEHPYQVPDVVSSVERVKCTECLPHSADSAL